MSSNKSIDRDMLLADFTRLLSAGHLVERQLSYMPRVRKGSAAVCRATLPSAGSYELQSAVNRRNECVPIRFRFVSTRCGLFG